MASWERNDLWEGGKHNPVEHPLGLQMRNVCSPPPTLHSSMLIGICYTDSGVWQVNTPVDKIRSHKTILGYLEPC